MRCGYLRDLEFGLFEVLFDLLDEATQEEASHRALEVAEGALPVIAGADAEADLRGSASSSRRWPVLLRPGPQREHRAGKLSARVVRKVDTTNARHCVADDVGAWRKSDLLLASLVITNIVMLQAIRPPGLPWYLTLLHFVPRKRSLLSGPPEERGREAS